MKRTFTIKNLMWRIAAILVVGVFSFSEVQAQCSCSTVGFTSVKQLDVSAPGNANATFIADADNQVLCLRASVGTSTFTGTINFANRSNVLLCIGTNVVFEYGANINNFGGVANANKITNKGTFNRIAFPGGNLSLTVNFNNSFTFINEGTANLGSFFVPITANFNNGSSITNSGNINIYGTWNNNNSFTNAGNINTPETVLGISSFNQGAGTITSTGSIVISGNANVSGGNIILGGSLFRVTGNYTQTSGNISGADNPLLPAGGCGTVNVDGTSNITGGLFGAGTGRLGMCDASTRNTSGNLTGFDNEAVALGFVAALGREKCNCFVALPVTLVYFRAAYSEGQVKLNWATASEEDNDYFTVEKSKDGVEFTEVTRVKGAGTVSGLRTYQSMDTQPYEGTSYYRLKQTDLDGKFTYSNIRSVNAGGSSRSASVFPNPVAQDGFVQVAVNSEQTGDIYVTVYDQIGKQCFSAKYTSDAIPSIAVKQFSTHSGLYIIQARKGSTIVREKVIVQ